MEMHKLEILLDKYKNIINSSYLKYNFIIEFHNIFDGIYKLDMTLKEKKSKNIKYPLKTYAIQGVCKQIKKPYFLTSNILYFLISDEFNSDIELLLIRKMDNESSIFNGLIINMDRYEIVCYPPKTKLISKNCNIKKFNMDEILYEYNIYKLYDGINISLYYYNKKWNISGFNKININNMCYDNSNSKLINKFNNIILKYIILGKIDLEYTKNIKENVSRINDMLEDEYNLHKYLKEKNIIIDDVLNNFYNVLNKKYTYNFVLINRNYNLCSNKDKIKFINKVNDKENIYSDELFNEIKLKEIRDLDRNDIINGVILISKNNNEDRVIFYNNYYNLNKYLYSHIKKNVFDINMIILKNILIHKINKNIFNEIFNKYKNVYNIIIKKMDNLVDYLYEYIIKYNFPNLDILKNEKMEEERIKDNFIELIIKFIKKNKYLNDIFFINVNEKNETELIIFKETYYHNKVLYKSMLKDYLYNKEIINDLYLYIFNK
jgi:hypothetical protein